MSSDFRLSTGLPNHPKIVKLRRKLGADGVLGFIYLLAHCAQFKRDGVLSGMDREDIAIVAQWPLEAETFVNGLLETKLLEDNDGILTIHDWAEHNPWVASFSERSEQARKAAEVRWEAERMRRASEPQCETHAQRNAPSPIPTPTPDPSPTPLPTPTPEESSRRVPENGHNGESHQPKKRLKVPEKEWESDALWLKNYLEHEQHTFTGKFLPPLLEYRFWDELSVAVNGIDRPLLEREFAKIALWVNNKPKQAPLPGGIRQFLAHWLTKAAEQDRRQARFS